MTKQSQPGQGHEHFVVRQPLQLYKERKRRYVRLEIAAPVMFAPIDMDRPLETAHLEQTTGAILNISGGGVLLTSDREIDENSYITMSFELTGCETLTGIVGRVKRVDDDGEAGFLLGVEFCTESELKSVFGEANIGSVISSFDNKVKRFLLRYIFTHKVDERLRRNNGQNETNA